MHFYRPQTKFPNVMFLHVSVSHSVHGVGSGIPACLSGNIPACLAGLQGCVYPSMPCRFPGPHPRGKLRALAGGSPGPHPGGSPGPHLGGVSRPTPGGGVCITACTEVDTCLTATVAGGTHPTGMHFCWQFIFVSYNIP